VDILFETVPDKFMGEFHRQGLAKEFDMRGSVTVTVRWKRGQGPVMVDDQKSGGRR